MASRNEYTATAAQVDFTYTFDIFADTDITVYKRAAGTDPDDATDLLTLTTDYTVTQGSSKITLVVGATAGDLVTLVQSIPVTREVEYQTNGDWEADVVNSDFDRLYALVNQYTGDFDERLLRFADSEQRDGKSNIIPTPEDGKALGWSATSPGDLENIALASVSTDTDIDAIISGGDAGKPLVVNGTEDGYEIGNVLPASFVDTQALNDDAVTDAKLDPDAKMHTASATYQVGATGDYTNLNAAIDDLSKKFPAYDNTEIRVTLNIEAGEVIAEQVLVNGLNLGWITITGTDASTTVTRSALTDNFSGDEYDVSVYPLFGAKNGGTLPVIGQLFAMDASGTATGRNGVVLINAKGTVLETCGVTGAYDGIHCVHASNISSRNTDFSGAGRYGALFDDASAGAVEQSDFSSAGTGGIYAFGGHVDAAQVDCSGAGTRGIYGSSGSVIGAASSDCSGAGSEGIRAANGTTIDALSANAQVGGSPAAVDFVVDNGGIINATSGTGGTSETVNTLTAQGIIFQ